VKPFLITPPKTGKTPDAYLDKTIRRQAASALRPAASSCVTRPLLRPHDQAAADLRR